MYDIVYAHLKSNRTFNVALKISRGTRSKMEHGKNLPTYIFATVMPNRLTRVFEELKRNSKVDLVAPLVGRYDLLIRLRHETPEFIHQSVREIREIDGVRETTYCTAFDGIENKPFEKEMKLGVSTIRVEHIPSEKMIKQLSSVPGFLEGYTVPGQFDVVALWQAKSDEDLVRTSVEKLPMLEGLSHSETFLAHSPFYKK